MWRKLLIGILAVAISVAAGYLLPFMNSDQSVGVRIDESKLQRQFNIELEEVYEDRLQESIANEWDSFAEDHEVVIDLYVAQLNGVEESAVIEMKDSVMASPIVIEGELTQENVENFLGVDGDEVAKLIEEQSGSEGYIVTEDIVREAWVNQLIEENRQMIDDGDLEFGLELYQRIDTEFLFGLVEDGMTQDDYNDALDYLEENLNEDEFNEVVELYFKYIGLVDQ